MGVATLFKLQIEMNCISVVLHVTFMHSIGKAMLEIIC